MLRFFRNSKVFKIKTFQKKINKKILIKNVKIFLKNVKSQYLYNKNTTTPVLDPLYSKNHEKFKK